jgi:pilus assembly protein CpaE
MMSMRWQFTPAYFDAYISAERRPSISPQMKAASLRIAFVDFDVDPEAAAESTRHLKQIFRNAIIVIAVGRPRDPDLLLMAMRCGCNEFLQKPVSHDVLIEILGNLATSTDLPEQDRERGSILSFFGVKGGVGTTTIAVHLAMYLVQCHGKKTLLIDNHAELGHACVYLGLDGSHFHFQEVLGNVSRLDSELLRGYVAKHESGLEVLSSPESCGITRNADPQSMRQTLEFLRGEYDFIIVDSAIGLEEANLAIIDAAAQTYLIATPEIASLRDLSRYLDAFKYVDGVQEKLRVVLNRYNSSSAVSLEQIETAIGQHVSLRLSNNHSDLQRVENLGHTLAPTCKVDFATQMVRWAAGLGGASVMKSAKPKHKRPHLFSWMQVDEVAH